VSPAAHAGTFAAAVVGLPDGQALLALDAGRPAGAALGARPEEEPHGSLEVLGVLLQPVLGRSPLLLPVLRSTLTAP
jgi:hypothetical protein